MTTNNQHNKKRLITLQVLQVLQKQSNEDHPLSQNAIAAQIGCERKAVGAAIADLRDMDYRIEDIKGKGVYLDPEISQGEIMLLIDSIRSFKPLTERYATELIEKVKALNSACADIPSAVNKSAISNNAAIFQNIEDLYSAIQRHQSVKFTYCDYSINGQLVPICEVECVPYSMNISEGYYYLLSYVHENGKTVTKDYRADKIKDLQILQEDVIPSYVLETMGVCDANQDVQQFVAQSDANTAIHRITAKLPKGKISVAYDSFNNKIQVVDETENEVTVILYDTLERVRNWALKNIRTVEILEPMELRKEMRHISQQLHSIYHYKQEDRYQSRVNERLDNELQLCKIDLSQRDDFLKRTDVKYLKFDENNITDFSFLKSFDYLRGLSICNNAVEALELSDEVYKHKSFGNLSLINTKVTSLEFVKNFKSVMLICLVDNPIQDYSPLYGIRMSHLRVDKETYEKLDLDKLSNSTNVTVLSPTDVKRLTRVFGNTNSKVRPSDKQFEEMVQEVKKRAGFRCQICGATEADGARLIVEHIVPVSKGGNDTPDNLRCVCDKHNIKQ